MFCECDLFLSNCEDPRIFFFFLASFLSQFHRSRCYFRLHKHVSVVHVQFHDEATESNDKSVSRNSPQKVSAWGNFCCWTSSLTNTRVVMEKAVFVMKFFSFRSKVFCLKRIFRQRVEKSLGNKTPQYVKGKRMRSEFRCDFRADRWVCNDTSCKQNEDTPEVDFGYSLALKQVDWNRIKRL